jgi:fatty-acyl-CoA synthase
MTAGRHRRDEGIGSWPRRRDRKTPDRTAIEDQGRRFSYRHLAERCRRLARAMHDLGLEPGERVAYLGPNHHVYLETMFAAGQLGAVFVPLNWRLTAPELAYIMADCGARGLIVAASHEPAAGELISQLGGGDRSGLEWVVTAGDSTSARPRYEHLLAGSAGEPPDRAVTLDDPCLLMYTSGTTGRPKGAVLTHGNLTWNCLNVVVDSDLSGDEVVLVCAPLFHIAALAMTCLPVILKGGTVVLEPAFDPVRVLDLIERRGVTFMFGVPAMYDAMAATDRWGSGCCCWRRPRCSRGTPTSCWAKASARLRWTEGRS